MKKVDDYIIDFWGTLKDGITKDGRYVSDYDIKLVLKQLQIDTIKETCRICARKAKTTSKQLDDSTWEVFINRDAILEVADELIEKL